MKEEEEEELAYPWRVRSGCLLEVLHVVFLLSIALFGSTHVSRVPSPNAGAPLSGAGAVG